MPARPRFPSGSLRSAYLAFVTKERTKIAREHPELTFAEIGKECGERWRALSDEQKRSYTLTATEENTSPPTKDSPGSGEGDVGLEAAAAGA